MSVANPENIILKRVSRSFYLSLRLLPVPMRGAASLAYLLARTSDTLADTAGVPAVVRLGFLDAFEQALVVSSGVRPHWPSRLLNAVAHGGEHDLLEITPELLDWLERIPAEQARLVREVVGIIIGGQRLDIERFDRADREHPVALENDRLLDDYTWRVAGCVGAFWTKLGFLTMGDRFSTASENELMEMGVNYGKGLQLVNILRDLPEDLAMGRCYLPVADPGRVDALLRSHRTWQEQASVWTGSGFAYARCLKSRRLRVATVLPAMIAHETLELMKCAGEEVLGRRVKVPRAEVYGALIRAIFGVGW